MGCNDYLPVTNPRVIEEIHASFMEAGADVLETDTFGGSRLKLDEYGLGDAAPTRSTSPPRSWPARWPTATARPTQPRFVAGSMGPTGMLPSSDDPTLSNITFDQLADIFGEQAQALVEGGVRPADHRDHAGHPGTEGGHRRRQRATSRTAGGGCRSRRR